MQTILAYLQTHFLARWVVANIAAWSIGLYLCSLMVQIMGFAGILLGGALTGAVVGGIQWWALRPEITIDWQGRRWLLWSVIGGVFSTAVVYMLGGIIFVVVLLAQNTPVNIMTTLIGGALFGGIFGAAQTVVLRDYFADGMVWVMVNILGGALCATCSWSANPFSLPIFCTFGPLLFGGITGYALLRLLDLGKDES